MTYFFIDNNNIVAAAFSSVFLSSLRLAFIYYSQQYSGSCFIKLWNCFLMAIQINV